YKKAITGGYPNSDDAREQNIIWGWNRLATIVQRYPQYLDFFFEARYNAAQALFDYGRTQKKQDDIVMAKKYLLITHKLYPSLGAPESPEWRQKYDELLADVQKALGEKPPYGLPQEDEKQAETARR
ncbi:MAG: hypothetical protein KY475_24190, partial [Planctomycetes bacterium]|nr:hypothetical protein [Planctomycetota bacterium]